MLLDQENLNKIYEEILIAPSNEIRSNRFSTEETSSAAPCNGKCMSGECRT